jgi:SAM-dependent methyltransferase
MPVRNNRDFRRKRIEKERAFMEERAMASIYDRPDIYDRIKDENGYEKYRKHWETILRGRHIESFLDVSIGSGNVTLPLADLGVSLAGSDLSQAMLEKCRKKANLRQTRIELRCCDFRTVADHFFGKFDCVASTGDSLPYVSNEDVLKTLEQMDSLVKPGGYLYFDVRNWDRILKGQKRLYLYNPSSYSDMIVQLIQIWSRQEDDTMAFQLLCNYEKNNTIFKIERFEEQYMPVFPNRLLEKIQEMGYKDIEVMNFPSCIPNAVDINEIDWYCVIARKP